MLDGGPGPPCKTVNGNVERRRPIVKYRDLLRYKLSEMWTPVGPSKEARIIWGAHWRNLANTIEPSMRGSDSAFLSNYLIDHLLLLL